MQPFREVRGNKSPPVAAIEDAGALVLLAEADDTGQILSHFQIICVSASALRPSPLPMKICIEWGTVPPTWKFLAVGTALAWWVAEWTRKLPNTLTTCVVGALRRARCVRCVCMPTTQSFYKLQAHPPSGRSGSHRAGDGTPPQQEQVPVPQQNPAGCTLAT